MRHRWSCPPTSCGLVVATLVVVAVVAATHWTPVAGCLLAVGAAVSCLPWMGWRGGTIILFLAIVAASSLGWRMSRAEAQKKSLLAAVNPSITARLREDARGNQRHWQGIATIVEGPAVGARVNWRGSGPLPMEGALLVGSGTCSDPSAPRNPGEFDRGAWLRSLGVVAEFRPVGGTDATGPSGLMGFGGRLRQGFSKAVVHGLEDHHIESQVILAMVTGQRPQEADDMVEDFRKSGALHVFCVSGLHVAMVGGIGWWVLGSSGLSRRAAAIGLIGLMFGYAWLSGMEPPAARAAWMGALYLGAFLLRRKPDLLHSMCAVLLASLLWDGRLLFLPGVQLSYGVVAAIALGMGYASKAFRWLARKELYLPDSERGWLRRMWDAMRTRLAASLSVSLAAAAGSMPLGMLHFGMITPISLLANLVLLPLVFLILSVALVSAAFYPVLPGASATCNQINRWAARGAMEAASVLESVPGGHIDTRRPGSAKLIVYDLPHGAMSSVQCGAAGDAVLLDTGASGSFRGSVLPSLRAQGIRPQDVLFSHPDGGHMGGGERVWQMLPVDRAVMPVGRARSRAFGRWQEAARDGVGLTQCHAGMILQGPDRAIWKCLYAPCADGIQSPADDRVAVWRLEWRGWRILFTSDAGYRVEKALLDSGADLPADVIVAGKHRQDVSLNEEFLTVVRPRVIVAKNPDYPPEERHLPAVVGSWRALGIHFMDQEWAGAVTIGCGRYGELVLTPFLHPQQAIVLWSK